jgi:hypothetical protein
MLGFTALRQHSYMILAENLADFSESRVYDIFIGLAPLIRWPRKRPSLLCRATNPIKISYTRDKPRIGFSASTYMMPQHIVRYF